MDKRSDWIWNDCCQGMDIYCDFYDSFDYSEGTAKMRISADSNYALYINGELAESGQYPDFPHYKVYDEFDVSSFCKKGKNSIAITVWHYGKMNMSYYLSDPALRYELWVDDTLKAFSSEKTLSRKDRAYRSGLCKNITGQLGLSFHYDITAEDGWKTGELDGFTEAAVLSKNMPMFPRPVKKLSLGKPVECAVLKSEGGTHFLYDIGREEVGYLTLKLYSEKKQKLTVTYGEHIVDGGVRRFIGPRDFSVEVTVGEGESCYTNPFRRLGLRYLEVFAESPIKAEYISVIPVSYPLEFKGKTLADPLDRAIYEVSVRTLELCMHEHYEDCPWREQALYCMDSRNQMLCGYYAFGEYEFPRACLKLMSEDRRNDGVLSICFPYGRPGPDNCLAIPSFSLHFFTQVYEYCVYSKDLTLAKEIYPKLCSVMKEFTDRGNGGCIPSFVGKEYWNFYEWSEGLEGNLGSADSEAYEAALNCLLIIALRNMAMISEMIGEKDEFTAFIEPIAADVRNRFFDAESGLFYNREDDGKRSELVNALAILSGVCTYDEARCIAAELTDEGLGLTPATLSMLCFKYDALLKVDAPLYREYILNDIRAKYKKMLDAGATTFWETEEGESAFGNAGSLCHGWSAMPVYYYETL